MKMSKKQNTLGRPSLAQIFQSLSPETNKTKSLHFGIQQTYQRTVKTLTPIAGRGSKAIRITNNVSFF